MGRVLWLCDINGSDDSCEGDEIQGRHGFYSTERCAAPRAKQVSLDVRPTTERAMIPYEVPIIYERLGS